MADSVKLRVRTFLAEPKGRVFTKRSSPGVTFCTDQEVAVDFVNRTVFANAEAYEAPDDQIRSRGIEWQEDAVSFTLESHAHGRQMPHETSQGYNIRVEVREDGQVRMRGKHDGYPCYEIYKQADDEEIVTVYTYDCRETGGEIEYRFDVER